MLGKNWLTIKEAAELVGCSTSRIRALASKADLKAVKVGERAWLIDRKAAEKMQETPAKTGRPRGTSK